MKFTFFSKVKKWKSVYAIIGVISLFILIGVAYAATQIRCNGNPTNMSGHLWDCYRVNNGQTVRVGDPNSPIAEWNHCQDVTYNPNPVPPNVAGIFIPTDKADQWQRLWDPTSRSNPLPNGLSLANCPNQPPSTNYTLTVTTSGTGSGTVTSNVGNINCGSICSQQFPSGTAVTLTASPSAGSTFTGWSLVGCPNTGTCPVTLNSDITVNATFTLTGGTCSTYEAVGSSGAIDGAGGGSGPPCNDGPANGSLTCARFLAKGEVDTWVGPSSDEKTLAYGAIDSVIWGLVNPPPGSVYKNGTDRNGYAWDTEADYETSNEKGSRYGYFLHISKDICL